MPIQQLYIINNAGSLMYSYSISKILSSNDHITLASSFFGLFAIANEASPIGSCSSGIKTIGTTKSNVACFESQTGTKFLISSDKSVDYTKLSVILNRVYRAYADFALKNPFTLPDQPLRASKFEELVQSIISSPDENL